MIQYKRQADGSFLKSGELVAAEVYIKIDSQESFSNSYTVAQATSIIENAIAKGQVNHDTYSIIPVPEKPLSGAAAKNAAKSAEAVATLTPEELARLATIQAEQNLEPPAALKVLRKEQKAAAKAAVKAAKPPKAPKASTAKQLTPEEEARVAVILAGLEPGTDQKIAVKQLRKEQRVARLAAARAAKPAKAPKAPKAPKPEGTKKPGLNAEDIAKRYKAGESVGAIAKALGASYMGVRLSLIRQDLLGKVAPVATEAVAEAPKA